MKDDINSLAHSKWNCKYHIVFAPKYRRMAIYGQIKKDIGKILRQLCEYKEVKNNKRRNVSRSCTYVGRNTTENKYSKFQGIHKRKKYIKDI